MTKRLVPGPRPSYPWSSVAGLRQGPLLCQSQMQGLYGKKDVLTLLQTAVDLLVLQQLLAVVLKRLISRVRHDEKPSLIGDAGNGHGRPGGGRGGARGESLPGEEAYSWGPRPFRLAPPLYSTSPTSASWFTYGAGVRGSRPPATASPAGRVG